VDIASANRNTVYEAHLGFGMGAKNGAAVILIAGAGSCSRDDRGRGVVRRLTHMPGLYQVDSAWCWQNPA